MDSNQTNAALSLGRIDVPGLFPKLEALEEAPFQFQASFGLRKLPREPGLILIRGARQYGKSTWLQEQIRLTIREFGPGTAFFLNGDELRTGRELLEAIRLILPLFSTTAPARRIFIDEVTAVRRLAGGPQAAARCGRLAKRVGRHDRVEGG